jgi:hypothetical protein
MSRYPSGSAKRRHSASAAAAGLSSWVIGKMCSSLSEQYARLVAFDDGHQHSGWPDRPHRSEGDDYGGIGVVIVPRNDVRIG